VLFKFKKKKIVVDAFTKNPAAYELFPIQDAKRYIPDWFKEIPASQKMRHPNNSDIYDEVGTLKNCPGFINLYKTGFIIPTWCDIQVQLQESGEHDVYQAGYDNRSDHVSHPPYQWGAPKNTTFDNLIHIKFHPPWQIKEKSGINFLLTAPTWNQYPSMIPNIVPGVINAEYSLPPNINTFWPKKSCRYKMEAGTPFAHLVPLTENDVEIKTHLIDSQEWDNNLKNETSMWKWAFFNQYGRMKKEKLKNKERNKDSKCPFGFK